MNEFFKPARPSDFYRECADRGCDPVAKADGENGAMFFGGFALLLSVIIALVLWLDRNWKP